MLQETSIANADPIEPGSTVHEVHSAPSCTYVDDDPSAIDWTPIAGNIVAAGGAYPILIFAGTIVVELCFTITSSFGSAPEEFFDVLVGGIVYTTASAVAGMVWTGIVTAIVLPIVYLLTKSLQLRVSVVLLGAFCGGLIGFVAILPLTLQLPYEFSLGRSWAAIVLFAIGPGLTIPLGQLSGARGARTSLRLAKAKASRHDALVAIGWRAKSHRTTDDGAILSASAEHPRIQFRIVHLMWIAVWLSLLLTIIRLSGIPYALILPVLLGWIMYQSFTLWLGNRLIRRLGPWWKGRRQSRST